MRVHFRRKQGGYTIIELAVVVIIFILLTAVVLASNSRFGGNILVTNLAYEIGLAIRQAQVYGISVREFNTSFTSGYGVHFDSSKSTSFLLFGDADGDKKYTAPAQGLPNTELLEQYNIDPSSVTTRGNTIKNFCVTSTSTTLCSSDGNGPTSLDIAFLRPNPDAIISTNLGSGYESATITIESKAGQTRLIKVFNTGQISIP